MQPAPRIAPPVVDGADEAASRKSAMSELDAGWLVDEPIAELDGEWVVEEPAATDGALLGKPDAALGYFPPGPSDAEIADLVDDFTLQLCRPNERRASKRGRSRR